MSLSVINGFSIPYMQTTREVGKSMGITSYPFYHGPLDGISCEELLRGRPNGTYIVRDGEKPKQFYLSWVADTDQCHFEHIPFIFSGDTWIRKNTIIGKNEDLLKLIPVMMHRSEDECIPLIKDF